MTDTLIAHSPLSGWTVEDPHARQLVRRAALVCALMLAIGLACHFGHGDVSGEVGAVAAVLTLPGAGWWLWRSASGRRCGPTEPLLASLTWSVLVGCIFAWVTETQPVVLFAGLAIPALVGVIATLRAAARSQTAVEADELVEPTSRSRSLRPRRIDLIALCLVGVAIYGIVESGHRARAAHIGNWGLLPALGIAFVVSALAAVALVFLGLAGRSRRHWISVAGLAIVAFDFAGVPNLVTSNFLGGWNYKHLGVVDLISIGHSLSDAKDLFQQWPGFFAVAADVARLSGNASLHYANWAELLFFGIVAFAVFCASLKLYPGRWDIAAVATVIMLVTAWAGQFYFSPQSMAMSIAMLMLAGSVDRLPTSWRVPDRLQRRLRIAPAADPPQRPSVADPDRGWIALMGAAFLAMVFTHQLTPYLVLAQLAPFLFARSAGRRSRIAFAVAAVVAIGYALLRITAVETTSVFNLFSLSTVAGSAITDPSKYQLRAATGAHVAALLTWGGAALCVLASRRRLQPIAVPMVLAAMPISLVLVGNYGGEAIYRVWLFSSPWCALIIAQSCCNLKRFHLLVGSLATLLCTGLFLASAQATDFGMWQLVDVPSTDIAASSWILRHAPAEVQIVDALTNFPGRLSWQYTLHDRPAEVNDQSLSEDQEFQGDGIARISAAALAGVMRDQFGAHSYLVVSNFMSAEAAYYGTVKPAVLPLLTRELSRSSSWRVVYRNSGAVIFQVLG